MIISNLSAADIFNYSQSMYIRPEIKINEPAAKTNENVQPDDSLSKETENYRDRETLPTKEVIDFAIEALDVDKNLIGTDSDINGLDVQKAVSNMQQDSILHQYQFFVGTASTPISAVSEPAPEKVLRSGENFYL